ncbi:MAG: mechanosensitive ion channel domain-containing protein [Gammaproteobacteria bacterium]
MMNSPKRPLLLLLLMFLILAGLAVPGSAAPASAPPVDAELHALIETLEDEAARERLLKELRGLLEAQRAQADEPETERFGAQLLAQISRRLDVVGGQLAAGTAALLDTPELVRQVADRAADPAVREQWFEMIAKLALILAMGLLAEWLARLSLRGPRLAFAQRGAEALPLRALLLVARGALDVLAIAVFAAAAYAVVPLTEPREVTRLIAITLINASVLVRLVGVAGELVFAAHSPGLRLTQLGDESAHYGQIWVRRLSVVAVYGYFGAEAALLSGMSAGTHGLMVKALGLVITAMLVILIMQNRHAVNRWLEKEGMESGEGRAMGSLRRRIGRIWHGIAIVYLLFIFGVWVLELEGGFRFLLRATVLSLLILFVARLVRRGLQQALMHALRLGGGLAQSFPALEERANRYHHVGRQLLNVVVHLVTALALLDVWGLQVFEWLMSDTGRDFSASALSIFFVLLGAALAWELISAMVEGRLQERDVAGRVLEPSARARTLLPLFRNAVRIVLILVAALMVLAELGLNIAPLLAGAGVVGLAVGFGAQSLVKDLITGVFILIEDSIAVGNVVDLGGHVGVVESMTVRTIWLRDLTGTVHVVPWGEVLSVMNLTKDFSFALMDVGVAYREDVDEVIEVLKEVGADLQADPEYGPEILEPLEVLGLDSFGDSSVNIRVRMKTRPIKQWWVRREFNRRMKRAFDARDIEIPFPHQTVYFGVDKAGGAPPARVALDGGPDAGAAPSAPSEPSPAS